MVYIIEGFKVDVCVLWRCRTDYVTLVPLYIYWVNKDKKGVMDKDNKSKYYEWLKKECAKELRKAGHKANNTGERLRHRRSFAKFDESKIKVIKGKSYWHWIELNAHRNLDGKIVEPLEANPDSFYEE